MADAIRLLDVVALTVDLPERGLRHGQVGTVVETLDGGAYEVEFSDNEGRTYAMAAVQGGHLLVLHHEPAEAGHGE